MEELARDCAEFLNGLEDKFCKVSIERGDGYVSVHAVGSYFITDPSETSKLAGYIGMASAVSIAAPDFGEDNLTITLTFRDE